MAMPISTSTLKYNTPLTCAYCHTTREKMKLCTGCFSTFYCNIECQKLHWFDHEAQCKNLDKDKETAMIKKTAMRALPSSSFRGPFIENQLKTVTTNLSCDVRKRKRSASEVIFE